MKNLPILLLGFFLLSHLGLATPLWYCSASDGDSSCAAKTLFWGPQRREVEEYALQACREKCVNPDYCSPKCEFRESQDSASDISAGSRFPH